MSKSKKLILIILIVLLAGISYFFFNRDSIKQTIESSITMIESIRKERTMEWLEKISMCESSNNPKAINLKDRDGTASYGLLQFKPNTFREYAEKYGIIGKEADLDWIMTIIWEEKIQKRLGYLILKNEPEKAKHLWPNCYRK